MIVLGVLVSGNGSNLQAIVDAIRKGSLDARVAVVISNVPGATALERARAAGVESLVLDHRSFADRASFDTAMVSELRARGVEVVVLAGFLRLVTDVLLDAFPMRIVNVHPALLPAFPGIHAQRQAIEYGVTVSRTTLSTAGPTRVPSSLRHRARPRRGRRGHVGRTHLGRGARAFASRFAVDGRGTRTTRRGGEGSCARPRVRVAAS